VRYFLTLAYSDGTWLKKLPASRIAFKDKRTNSTVGLSFLSHVVSANSNSQGKVSSNGVHVFVPSQKACNKQV